MGKWADDFVRDIERVDKSHEKKKERHANKIKKYRKEVSRKAAIANKRLRRLEEKGVRTPAYEKWKSEGGEYFSIRGKSYNEVQSEMARINSYLESATSTLSGAKRVVRQMIDNTGMDVEWSDWEDLKKQTANFFEIASRVEQYFRTVEDSASSIGYQKIWEAINRYVADSKSGLKMAEHDVDRITKDIVKSMKLFDKTIKDDTTGYSVWSTLDKK